MQTPSSAVKPITLIQQNKRDIAIKIAIQANVLVRCKYHKSVIVKTGTNYVEEALQLASNQLGNGKLKSVFLDPGEIAATISSVVEDAEMRCHECLASH